MIRRRPTALLFTWLCLWAEVSNAARPTSKTHGDSASSGHTDELARDAEHHTDGPAAKESADQSSFIHVEDEQRDDVAADSEDDAASVQMEHYAKKASSKGVAKAAVAWDKVLTADPMDKAAALGTILGQMKQEGQMKQGDGTDVIDKSEDTTFHCSNHQITCPMVTGDGRTQDVAPVVWCIKRSGSVIKKLADLTVGASVVLLALMIPPGVGLLAGAAVASGYVGLRALFSGGKPGCPYVEFMKARDGSCPWIMWTKLTGESVSIEDLNMAMTVDFIEQAVKTPDNEAHALKHDIIRNGQAMFACNVLMFDNSTWDTKMANSELYTSLERPSEDEIDTYARTEMAGSFMQGGGSGSTACDVNKLMGEAQAHKDECGEQCDAASSNEADKHFKRRKAIMAETSEDRQDEIVAQLSTNFQNDAAAASASLRKSFTCGVQCVAAKKDECISDKQYHWWCQSNVVDSANANEKDELERAGFDSEEVDRLPKYNPCGTTLASGTAQEVGGTTHRSSGGWHSEKHDEEVNELHHEVEELHTEVTELHEEVNEAMKSGGGGYGAQAGNAGGKDANDDDTISWVEGEKRYVQSLSTDEPMSAALRYCRYILCKRARSLERKHMEFGKKR